MTSWNTVLSLLGSGQAFPVCSHPKRYHLLSTITSTSRVTLYLFGPTAI